FPRKSSMGEEGAHRGRKCSNLKRLTLVQPGRLNQQMAGSALWLPLGGAQICDVLRIPLLVRPDWLQLPSLLADWESVKQCLPPILPLRKEIYGEATLLSCQARLRLTVPLAFSFSESALGGSFLQARWPPDF